MTGENCCLFTFDLMGLNFRSCLEDLDPAACYTKLACEDVAAFRFESWTLSSEAPTRI